MPKVKLEAGAELDFLNQKELDHSLLKSRNNWLSQISQDVLIGYSVVTLLANTSALIGRPPSGYIWAVTNVVSGVTDTQLLLNDNVLIADIPTLQGTFSKSQVVVYPGNELWAKNATATSITLFYIQVPIMRVGELLL